MQDKGQDKGIKTSKNHENGLRISDFVLDKFIFSNVFEKDIRRIYIYRKTERLAKALQMIAPAFASAPSLRTRLDGISVALIDAAILPPNTVRAGLSRELLALSSILSVASAGSMLSEMNAEIIAREAHMLLQEIASYEEPRLFLEESPTLAELAKRAPDVRDLFSVARSLGETIPNNLSPKPATKSAEYKGHLSDISQNVTPKQEVSAYSARQESILKIIKSKGPVYIKDISTLIREVSEKTIQRELQSLVNSGAIHKEGERRWTRYSMA
jgi:DNA-binding transcriptional ArsR family regulator